MYQTETVCGLWNRVYCNNAAYLPLFPFCYVIKVNDNPLKENLD